MCDGFNELFFSGLAASEGQGGKDRLASDPPPYLSYDYYYYKKRGSRREEGEYNRCDREA